MVGSWLLNHFSSSDGIFIIGSAKLKKAGLLTERAGEEDFWQMTADRVIMFVCADGKMDSIFHDLQIQLSVPTSGNVFN